MSNRTSNLLKELSLKVEQDSMNLSLKRVQEILNALQNPCSSKPAIQIAGTNGKGSIASFINSALTAARIKTGVLTSPHLINWHERICINQKSIPEKRFLSHLYSIKELSKQYRLTTFELLFIIALNHFSEEQVDLLLLEVGLGGRLDATTAHPKRPVIAMGPIGMDHCEYLGNSLEEITKQKAAVITPFSTVISANQHPTVRKMLIEVALEQHATIKWVAPLGREWELGLQGYIQRENAAVAKGALEALATLGWYIAPQSIKEGFALTKWQGRLQKVFWEGNPLLIDCAHNSNAAKHLSKEREHWEDNVSGVHWVLGIQRKKDAPAIVRHLVKGNDWAWIVEIPGHDSWDRDSLSKACPNLNRQFIQAKTVQEALTNIKATSKWPKPPPVITGSLYLIGYLFYKNLIQE